MKKLLFIILLTPLALLSYEPDYAMYCDERHDAVSCMKAAFKKRYNTNSYIDYLTKSCKYGHKDGCYALSKAYIDYKQDPQKSGEYYLKACNMGHAKACYDIGMMAANLNKQFQKNLYLDKSCELGFELACKSLDKKEDLQ